MKKLLILLLLAFLVIPFVSAEQQSLGTFQKDNEVNLIQNCINSTYSNITRIVLPDSTPISQGNLSMTKTGDDYNYTFKTTYYGGSYLVYGSCDENGAKTNWQYDFFITEDGKEHPPGSKWGMIIFLSILGGCFLLLSIYLDIIPLGTLSGITFIALGVLFYTSGVPGYETEFVRNVVSGIVLGFGFLISAITSLLWMEEYNKLG